MGPRSRIYGECGDDLFRPWRKTKNLFRASPEEEMVFYISTNRRSAGVAFEYVRINDIKLKTVALGDVSSAGVLIFLAGGKRSITASSILRVHEIFQRSFRKEHQLTDLKKMVDSLKQDEKRCVEIITSRTGLPTPQAQKMVQEDTLLDSAEAKELGFAHEIV